MRPFIFTILIFCNMPQIYVQEMNLVDSIDLTTILTFAERQALDAKEARKNLAVSEITFDIVQAGWKPYLGLNANIPGYYKTFQETIQPNGSIAFQPISQNSSFANIGISQVIPYTGGTLFLSTSLQRFDDFSNNLTNFNGKPLRLSLVQPIFGFNNLKWEKRIEPQRLLEAKKGFIFQMENVKYNTVSLYFDALQAYLEVEIAEQNKDNNRKLYEIAEERYDLGKISENDLLQLELELVQANKDLNSNGQIFKTAFRSLLNYIGGFGEIPEARPVIPTHPDFFSIDEEQARDQAVKNRFEYNRQLRRIEEQQREVERVKRNLGPNVELIASLGVARGADNVETVYTDARQEQQVAISMNIPIYDWGRRRNEIKRAAMEVDYLNHESDQISRDIDANVEDIINRFINVQEELALSADVKRVADRRYNISNDSYVLGNISITDLTIAINEKDSASRDYVRTLRKYWEAYFALRLLTLYDFENQTPITYSLKN